MDSKNSPDGLVIGQPQRGRSINRPARSRLAVSARVIDGRPFVIVLDPWGELSWGAGR